MEMSNQPGDEDVVVPGPRAELQMSIGPSLKQWGTFRGRVPADQAHHLITTFGILGSAAAGIGGAVFTPQDSSGPALAYAELALALIAAVLIALCARKEATGTRQQQKPDIPAPQSRS
jgi:hypothetical protein